MSEVTENLQWAMDTITYNQSFGLDALGASLSRERRAYGVMMDAIKDLK